jgi:hypothetical protein
LIKKLDIYCVIDLTLLVAAIIRNNTAIAIITKDNKGEYKFNVSVYMIRLGNTFILYTIWPMSFTSSSFGSVPSLPDESHLARTEGD